MAGPKAPKESAADKAYRLQQEARTKAMQAQADAEDAAAGRTLMTRRTRMVMRLFGARRAMAQVAGTGNIGSLADAGGTLSTSAGASVPLGYTGGRGSSSGGVGGRGGGGLLL